MLRRICSLAVLFAGCAAAPQLLDPADPAEFTAVAAEMTRAFGEPVTVEVGEPLVLLVRREADTHELSLKSAWRFCHQEPGDCDAATRRYLRQALDRLATIEPRRG